MSAPQHRDIRPVKLTGVVLSLHANRGFHNDLDGTVCAVVEIDGKDPKVQLSIEVDSPEDWLPGRAVDIRITP